MCNITIYLKGGKVSIDRDWLDNLRAHCDIVSVIQKYVPLTRRGKTYWACCPFHFEKTPSFAVNEYDGYYHCFGCGCSGDVVKFVMNMENVEFFDAVKMLAKDANIEIPEYTVDENVLKQKKRREVALKVLRDSAVYYFKNLYNDRSKPALEYMKKRGLTQETIKAFGIGYSLGFGEIIPYLQKLGYTNEQMVDSGVVEKSTNGRLYDGQAERLVFPIQNSYGDVVGFSGRVLGVSEYAKYKNTAETIAFNKSKCIYGIYQLKKYKQTNPIDHVLIVEGQMDVISLYQAGIRNAVACMGTAMTIYHAKELKKYSDKIILSFDGDNAGKKATLRAIDILLSIGCQIYINTIPNNQDPDEYVKEHGVEAFKELVSHSKYWVDHMIDMYASMYNLKENVQKSQFVTECLCVINKLSTESEKDIYLDKVRQLSNIATSSLKRDMENLSEVAPQLTPTKTEKTSPGGYENNYAKATKFILSALLHKKPYAYTSDDIKNNLTNNNYIQIYNYIERELNADRKPIIGTLFSMFDVDQNSDVDELINYQFSPDLDTSKYYESCIACLVNITREKRKSQILEELKNVTDLSERKNLINELNQIIKNK